MVWVGIVARAVGVGPLDYLVTALEEWEVAFMVPPEEVHGRGHLRFQTGSTMVLRLLVAIRLLPWTVLVRASLHFMRRLAEEESLGNPSINLMEQKVCSWFRMKLRHIVHLLLTSLYILSRELDRLDKPFLPSQIWSPKSLWHTFLP